MCPFVTKRLGTHVVGQYFRAPLHASWASEDLTRHARLPSDRRLTIYPNDLLGCNLKIYYKQVRWKQHGDVPHKSSDGTARSVSFRICDRYWRSTFCTFAPGQQGISNETLQINHIYASEQTSQSLAILILSSVGRIFNDAVPTIPTITFHILITYFMDFVHRHVLKDDKNKNYDINNKLIQHNELRTQNWSPSSVGPDRRSYSSLEAESIFACRAQLRRP